MSRHLVTLTAAAALLASSALPSLADHQGGGHGGGGGQGSAGSWHRGVRIAHVKTMVIDSKVTLMGSMNWSSGAAQNSEDLNLVVSPEVAGTYAGHWRQRLAASVPFVDGDAWCRQRTAGNPL